MAAIAAPAAASRRIAVMGAMPVPISAAPSHDCRRPFLSVSATKNWPRSAWTSRAIARERRLVDEQREAPHQREARGQIGGRQAGSRRAGAAAAREWCPLPPPYGLNLDVLTESARSFSENQWPSERLAEPRSSRTWYPRQVSAAAGEEAVLEPEVVGEGRSAARRERRRDGLQRGPQRRGARGAPRARARRVGPSVGGRARRRRLERRLARPAARRARARSALPHRAAQAQLRPAPRDGGGHAARPRRRSS